ncbi:MAG: hypothetical protein IJ671_01570 [Succinivibrio sp.]|jgi:hypothetical protein|nr:hypothetical protein [Succinivibrio sp.]MBR1612227.1 hypothetical protein [Succinivibrio sp.]
MAKLNIALLIVVISFFIGFCIDPDHSAPSILCTLVGLLIAMIFYYKVKF